MKNLKILSLAFIFISLLGFKNVNGQDSLANYRGPSNKQKIQVAILLDASSSMNGLIDQAKSKLWSIVNTLTTIKYQGKDPGIEIALYMYGNDGLSAASDYIKQITPFTSDLDLISEKLFAITTNGGSEYCGAVIGDAESQLDWGKENNNMKLIYIAGNEPFNQGKKGYIETIANAVKKDIYINTIHCGDCQVGITGLWKDGADRGRGKYFCINQNEKVVYVTTPYDDQINKCNIILNNTYVYYGSSGSAGYANQTAQDNNAGSISLANTTERVISKSKSVYNNTSWDLIDKVKADSTYIYNVDLKTLPAEYQNLNPDELQALVDKKTKERTDIQKEISELSKKRQEYIKNQTATTTVQDDFGNAVNASILEIAKLKGYEIKLN